jgi:hypothetical protein
MRKLDLVALQKLLRGKGFAFQLSLRHYGKRKIVAIATFVTRLQMSAVDCYDRAIGEIGKGPGDRCGCSVADGDSDDASLLLLQLCDGVPRDSAFGTGLTETIRLRIPKSRPLRPRPAKNGARLIGLRMPRFLL